MPSTAVLLNLKYCQADNKRSRGGGEEGVRKGGLMSVGALWSQDLTVVLSLVMALSPAACEAE